MKDIATPATQPIEKDEFETWLGERPKWLQTAARQIIDHKRHLNPEEIAALALLCQSEATGEKDAIFLQSSPALWRMRQHALLCAFVA